MALTWDANSAFVAVLGGCIIALFVLRRLAGNA